MLPSLNVSALSFRNLTDLEATISHISVLKLRGSFSWPLDLFYFTFYSVLFDRWATRDIARLHIRSRTVQSVDKNRIKTSKINYGSTLIKKSLVSKSRKSQRNGRMTYCNDFSFSFNSCCNNWVKLKVFCTKFFFHEQGPASKVNK